MGRVRNVQEEEEEEEEEKGKAKGGRERRQVNHSALHPQLRALTNPLGFCRLGFSLL
jgi:hypothetical protein